MKDNSKHFKKRDAILSFIRSSEQHPSAEMVYMQLKHEIPDLSLATVYRNLSLFKKQGLIQSIGNVNGVERFDGILVPHVHFICNCCGEVEDLENLQVPESLWRKAAAEAGADVDQCLLTFFGTCSKCSGKAKSELPEEVSV